MTTQKPGVPRFSYLKQLMQQQQNLRKKVAQRQAPDRALILQNYKEAMDRLERFFADDGK